MFLVIATLVFLLGFRGTTAAQDFWRGKEEGWWFYRDPPQGTGKELGSPTPPRLADDKASISEPSLFSAKWIAKNLERLQEIAIDQPTTENVTNFLYAQRVMLDKSDDFAAAALRVSKQDPFLDENNRFPMATVFRALAFREEDAARQEAMNYLAHAAGIWFFFSSACNRCQAQYEITDRLARKYGFILYNVSIDGKPLHGMQDFRVDQGQFRRFQLQLTPTTVLVVPPDQYLIVSQGVMAQTDLESRIMAVAEDRNLFPKDLKARAIPQNFGLLTADDLRDRGQELSNQDAGAWVRYLRQSLEKRY